ncbi:MAG TPA: NADH-quinone oxidoreductase subunit C [Usitatibacteraceae bacterium]|nr:NADH-quinone oxidoreductase subunit C [Usitatibacteraceae bacterium]
MGAEVFDSITARLAARQEEASSPGTARASTTVSHGVLVVDLAPSAVEDAVRALKGEFAFDIFLDVTAIDWPGQDPRFEVVWHFYSTTHKVRVRLKARVPEANPVVVSLTSVYGSAAFMERECHDMYGIVFEGNADLRPILLYEGFVGHPLRKDYPKDREQPLVPYRE